MIVLTDGDDTASTIPLDVVEKLIKKYNIKLYTIGIGESNKFILNRLAKINNGKFFEANSKQDLKDVYENINNLEKSEIDKDNIIKKEYYFFYPLLIAIMALILFLVLKIRTNKT